jgi:hypothetical protein
MLGGNKSTGRCFKGSVVSASTINKTFIQGFIDHLGCFLCEDSAIPSNHDDENFYALLASNLGTGIPAIELRRVFHEAAIDLVKEAKPIFNDFLESDEDCVGYLISLCSLILDFSIAYEDLAPPSFKNRCLGDLEKIHTYLALIRAFEDYSPYIRGVDAPTFIYQRYNPRVDFVA